MTIDISCEKCGKAYSVPDHMSGKRVKCARCGEAFTVFPPLAELGSDDELFAADLLTGSEGSDLVSYEQVADPLFGNRATCKAESWTTASRGAGTRWDGCCATGTGA